MSIDLTAAAEVVYPESDGKPMADNTLQWEWMVKIVDELRELFAGQQVFVAGDLFWYPVQGSPRIVTAPDALVAFGRPPGHRGSYKQWEEEGIAPQVVFEILSPGNTDRELADKLRFYDRHGVEEYYLIDPDANALEVHVRRANLLVRIRRARNWISPRLGIRFDESADSLTIYRPDGRPFMNRDERVREMQTQADHEAARANEAEVRAREAEARAKLAAERQFEIEAEKHYLLERLIALGVKPEELLNEFKERDR